MHMYPRHVDGFVKDASAVFDGDASPVHKYYSLWCACGCRSFFIRISNLRSVIARCASCQHDIVVYDLQMYPTAIKTRGEEVFAPLPADIDQPSIVYVLYEYSEPEEDVEFDQDDISWCQVFVKGDSGEIVKVFDDETC